MQKNHLTKSSTLYVRTRSEVGTGETHVTDRQPASCPAAKTASVLPKTGNKVSASTSRTQHGAGVRAAASDTRRKQTAPELEGKKRNSLCADDTTLCVENPKDSTNTRLERTTDSVRRRLRKQRSRLGCTFTDR